jgi:DNA-binding NarL/FixJ family response regulator
MNKQVIAYDDEGTLRKQLEGLFYPLKAEYTLAATFAHADLVLEHIKIYKPDVILLDIDMRQNEEDGLMALYAIKKHHPDQKVMMLTTFDNDDKVFNAICLGADGYMLKTDFINHIPQEVMRRSLNIIFSDGAYLTPAVAKKILHLFRDVQIGEKVQKVIARFTNIFNQSKSPKQQNMAYKLTKTEMLTLEDIAEGKTAIQIAKERGVKETTIYTHIKAIYRELEVHTRGEAIRKAIEERLVKLKK